MQAVKTETRVKATGKIRRGVDRCGGVFVPVPGKMQRPAYSLGPATAKARDVMFQCPVSAIPLEVTRLLLLWERCRLVGLPPVAGGFLDQPLMVQRAFPVFEALRQQADRDGGSGPERAAALAVGTMFRMMGGGGKGK